MLELTAIEAGVDGFLAETLVLGLAGLVDLGAHRSAIRPLLPAGEFVVRDGGDFDVDVDAVEQGAGKFGEVFVVHLRPAACGAFGVAAEGGVHGGDEHESGGEFNGAVDAGDGDLAAFEGLAQHLQDITAELGKLIEEEDSVVGHRAFTGAGDGAATDEGLGGCAVVRRADRPLVEEGYAVGEHAHRGIDTGGFKRFGTAEQRKDAGDALGEHRFAGAGGTDHQQIVGTGGGDGDGAFDGFLAANFDEIQIAGDLGGEIGMAVEFVGFEGELLVEECDGLREGADGVDFDAFDDGGLACVFKGEDHAAKFFLLGEHGEGERTFYFAELAVEGEFTGDEQVFVDIGVDGIAGAEQADGDGEIEGGAFFFDIGGCEVDELGVGGEGEAAVNHGTADAFDGFADGGLGEADDGGFFQAVFGNIHLDLAEDGVDSDEDKGVDF